MAGAGATPLQADLVDLGRFGNCDVNQQPLKAAWLAMVDDFIPAWIWPSGTLPPPPLVFRPLSFFSHVSSPSFLVLSLFSCPLPLAFVLSLCRLSSPSAVYPLPLPFVLYTGFCDCDEPAGHVLRKPAFRREPRLTSSPDSASCASFAVGPPAILDHSSNTNNCQITSRLEFSVFNNFLKYHS